jgi:hypothetical protein
MYLIHNFIFNIIDMILYIIKFYLLCIFKYIILFQLYCFTICTIAKTQNESFISFIVSDICESIADRWQFFSKLSSAVNIKAPIDGILYILAELFKKRRNYGEIWSNIYG